MTILSFQTIMLPLLKLAEDGKGHYIYNSVKQLAKHFKLTEEERSKLQISGQQLTFYNRGGRALTYLKKYL